MGHAYTPAAPFASLPSPDLSARGGGGRAEGAAAAATVSRVPGANRPCVPDYSPACRKRKKERDPVIIIMTKRRGRQPQNGRALALSRLFKSQ